MSSGKPISPNETDQLAKGSKDAKTRVPMAVGTVEESDCGRRDSSADGHGRRIDLTQKAARRIALATMNAPLGSVGSIQDIIAPIVARTVVLLDHLRGSKDPAISLGATLALSELTSADDG